MRFEHTLYIRRELKNDGNISVIIQMIKLSGMLIEKMHN